MAHIELTLEKLPEFDVKKMIIDLAHLFFILHDMIDQGIVHRRIFDVFAG